MNEFDEILFTPEQIQTRVREMAKQIAQDYAGKELVVIGILKGAFVFLSDLIRSIPFPLTVDFVHASSYGMGTVSSRVVTIKKEIETDITGKDVLLVDCIIDTGETLHQLFERYSTKKPASIRTAVLMDKHSRRTVDVPVHYTGFVIPDKFVVGYGIDCGEHYRNMPAIGSVPPSK